MTAFRGQDPWIEQVRAANDIVEVIGATVALKRQGRNWVGLCPFHGEKTPSFAVNPERQFYHCFGCKAGGDVFKFVQETEQVGFVEAAERLSRRAGIPVPERRPGEAHERGIKARLLEALERATVVYEQWLADPARGAAARAALEARGIDRETQRTFRLGAAPPGWEHLVTRLKGEFDDEVLVQAGLAARRDRGAGPANGAARGGLYDRFRNRLMVPLTDGAGAVLGFGARSLAPEDLPKYLNSPESPVYRKSAFLFGLGEARRHGSATGELVVVEGYFDAIALHRAGITHVVATSGTALTAEHARALRRLVPRVVLTFDGDAAGQAAMLRSLGVLIAEGLEVRVADLPSGTDPDDLVRTGGAPAWEGVRRVAADPVSFIQRYVVRGGTGDPRERALRAVADLAAQAVDPLVREGLVRRADEVFGVELLGFGAALRRAVALRARGEGVERPIAAVVQRQRAGEAHREHELLRLLIRHPEGVTRLDGYVGPEDFRGSGCAAAAAWVWEGAAGDPPPEAETLVRELTVEGDAGDTWEPLVDVAGRMFLMGRLQRELRERRNAMSRDDDPAALAEVNALGERVARLSEEIEAVKRVSNKLGV